MRSIIQQILFGKYYLASIIWLDKEKIKSKYINSKSLKSLTKQRDIVMSVTYACFSAKEGDNLKFHNFKGNLEWLFQTKKGIIMAAEGTLSNFKHVCDNNFSFFVGRGCEPKRGKKYIVRCHNKIFFELIFRKIFYEDLTHFFLFSNGNKKICFDKREIKVFSYTHSTTASLILQPLH